MAKMPPKGSKMPGMGSKKGAGKGMPPGSAKPQMPPMPFKKGGGVGMKKGKC